jgi:hypothetical protein
MGARHKPIVSSADLFNVDCFFRVRDYPIDSLENSKWLGGSSMSDVIVIGSWLLGLSALVGSVLFMTRDLQAKPKKK